MHRLRQVSAGKTVERYNGSAQLRIEAVVSGVNALGEAL